MAIGPVGGVCRPQQVLQRSIYIGCAAGVVPSGRTASAAQQPSCRQALEETREGYSGPIQQARDFGRLLGFGSVSVAVLGIGAVYFFFRQERKVGSSPETPLFSRPRRSFLSRLFWGL